MKLKPVLLVTLITLTMIGCKKKTTQTDLKITKPDISNQTNKVLDNLFKPKAGFECELEVLDTGDKSQVFYLDRSEKSPESPLIHKIYTVNKDGESVKPNIVIGKVVIFFYLSYSSETDGIYKTSKMTVKPQESEEEDKKYIPVQANISFDSKINEFNITLFSQSFDDQSEMVSVELGSAKIGNCVEAEMIVPPGLD